MSKERVIAIFDIGKTNKKILLFDSNFRVVFQKEGKFKTTIDIDGDECDNIELIENWIKQTLSELIIQDEYKLMSVNFTTYGASLAFIDEFGKRLTPIYNYLKEVPLEIQNDLFRRYGGEEEFCRKTASPALGLLLNSGIQILWMKQQNPEVFSRVKSILHFPQYLSFLLTGKAFSESTSIGCHTFLWDFDKNSYHSWLRNEGISLPFPRPNSFTIPIEIEGSEVQCGIGIHDSSASVAPYIRGSEKKFLLVSTGTWCINMNPFNHSPLTDNQLKNDCLSFLSIDQNPVKSSRLFMGHIHDVNYRRMMLYFGMKEDSYKYIKTREDLLLRYLSEGKKKMFFRGGLSKDYLDETIDLSCFEDYSEAYHRLIYDLTILNCESIDYIREDDDEVDTIYVSGGFARNEIFVRLLANFYPDCIVYTSEVDNSSAMGAALVVSDGMFHDEQVNIDLGLKAWEAF